MTVPASVLSRCYLVVFLGKDSCCSSYTVIVEEAKSSTSTPLKGASSDFREATKLESFSLIDVEAAIASLWSPGEKKTARPSRLISRLKTYFLTNL